MKKAKHPNPLIFLNGTKKVEIEAVMSFLYHGEVTICQENLEQFLLAAKELKIRGILEEEGQNLLEDFPKRKDASKSGVLETGEIQRSKPEKKTLIQVNRFEKEEEDSKLWNKSRSNAAEIGDDGDSAETEENNEKASKFNASVGARSARVKPGTSLLLKRK